MKCLIDPGHALDVGLAAIRAELGLPGAFPDGVLAAVTTAVRRTPDAHADRTDRPFVTLDPEGATDLDQAFAIEAAGSDLLLHYAIADVGWFVRPGDPLDIEAWKRGTTLYFPDGRIPLYPPELSEGAASLLPDGDRPAVVFAVRIAPDGKASLDGVERALIRSRAKLAYETASDADLPDGFTELARRVKAAEAARGAARVDPPEQEVARDGAGGYTLAFRPRTAAEEDNAALSLACNLAVGEALLAAKTGLFRVMAEPDQRAVRRLRHTAAALGLEREADRAEHHHEAGHGEDRRLDHCAVDDQGQADDDDPGSDEQATSCVHTWVTGANGRGEFGVLGKRPLDLLEQPLLVLREWHGTPPRSLWPTARVVRPLSADRLAIPQVYERRRSSESWTTHYREGFSR